jgi:hypothetical protein
VIRYGSPTVSEEARPNTIRTNETGLPPAAVKSSTDSVVPPITELLVTSISSIRMPQVVPGALRMAKAPPSIAAKGGLTAKSQLSGLDSVMVAVARPVPVVT